MSESADTNNRARGGRPGFGVAASPLNAVKLDLGVILVGGFTLLLLHGQVDAPQVVQVGLLLVYGIAGMLWLVVRTRRVARSVEQQRDGP